MREICTYGLMRGRAYPTRGVPLYSTLLPRFVDEMKKAGMVLMSMTDTTACAAVSAFIRVGRADPAVSF